MDGNHARDFMDAYAYEIRKRSDEPAHTSTFEVEQMLSVFSDLLITGFETTAVTLRWAIVYILNFPEIKERLQSDIDRVLGKDRFPSLGDKSKLSYVKAFILETLRFADIVPLSVPHATVDDKDIIFEGFRISKGTTVMFNLDSVLSDPDIFENPKEFNPQRFLDETGDVFQQKELIPFSVGRRICLGEAMAKMELFLYITTLLKFFDFLPPEGELPPDMKKGNPGVTYSPCPFEVRAVYI